MEIEQGVVEIIRMRWPLLVVGMLILIGFAGLLWQRRHGGPRWRRDVTFYVDLIALAITGLVIGTIATTQLTAPPEIPPTPQARAAVVVPTATATPTARPTLPPPPTATPTATATPTPTPPTTVTHVVVQGDTLLAIAQQYGVTVAVIRERNNLTSDILQVDQELVIPLPTPTPGPATTEEASEDSTEESADSGEIVHVVKQGQTLGFIAMLYGVTVDDIQAVNPGLNPERLSIGQEILIPNQPVTPTPPAPTATATSEVVPTATPTPTPTATFTPTPAPTVAPRGGEKQYVVQSGDTLYEIADQFGVSVEAIRKRNGLTSDFLQVEQQLIIPDPLAGVPTNTPAPTRAPTATPFPTVTSTPMPAPRLLSPRDGERFSGETTEILLRWEWAGTLGQNDWFDVQMWLEGEPPQGRTWTKQTSWQVDPMFHDNIWNWRVVVVRGVQGASRTEISPPSETRRFFWHN